MAVQDVTLERVIELIDQGAPLFDARAPVEFAEGSIPGAVNLPLFSDEERAEIGTLYKHKGRERAVERGIEIVSPQIPSKLSQAKSIVGDRRKPVVVYCWRGGMRSQALATFLDLAGYRVYRLIGGYKAFRKMVVEFLEKGEWARFFVLRGLTGVGKTLILRRMMEEEVPVLDLEGLANHRGSAFGAFGLPPQPTQKNFESLLWNVLRKVPADGFVVTEGESALIGRIRLPKRVYDDLQVETSLWLSAGIDYRAKIILDDYPVGDDWEEEFENRILSIKNRLGGEGVELLLGYLKQGDWESLARELMVRYYDPLYLHLLPDNRIDIDLEPIEEGYQRVMEAIRELAKTERPPRQTG